MDLLTNHLLTANIIRSLAMAELAFASSAIAIFVTVKKQYYTTIRAAMQVIGVGLVIIFLSLTLGLWNRLGQPLLAPVIGLMIGGFTLDIGIIWAFWKNKFHL